MRRETTPTVERNSMKYGGKPTKRRIICIDEVIKSRKCPKIVIPVETGIQRFQLVTKILDTGFHRCDDF
ncbi:MAG: hypothetical protein ACOYOS_20885 [Syntrophales bacterium]